LSGDEAPKALMGEVWGGSVTQKIFIKISSLKRLHIRAFCALLNSPESVSVTVNEVTTETVV